MAVCHGHTFLGESNDRVMGAPQPFDIMAMYALYQTTR